MGLRWQRDTDTAGVPTVALSAGPWGGHWGAGLQGLGHTQTAVPIPDRLADT